MYVIETRGLYWTRLATRWTQRVDRAYTFLDLTQAHSVNDGLLRQGVSSARVIALRDVIKPTVQA